MVVVSQGLLARAPRQSAEPLPQAPCCLPGKHKCGRKPKPGKQQKRLRALLAQARTHPGRVKLGRELVLGTAHAGTPLLLRSTNAQLLQSGGGCGRGRGCWASPQEPGVLRPPHTDHTVLLLGETFLPAPWNAVERGQLHPLDGEATTDTVPGRVPSSVTEEVGPR